MIGLCLAFETQNNYGTQLQAYATIQAVKELGYECEIILYHRKINLKELFLLTKRLFQDNSLKMLMKKIKKKKMLNSNSEFSKNYKVRQMYVRKFKDNYFFPMAKIFNGYEELTDGVNRYSTVMSGSDQVWLPSGYASKFYTMMFVPDNIPKLSYASSFGVSIIPSYHVKEAKQFLQRLNFISVREIKGQELVKLHSGRDATVVVDPTMLIDPIKWENLCQPISENKYIFCYFLGTKRNARIQALKLSKLTGMQIVVLKHLDEYIPEDDVFGDISPFDVGPEKFISYIKNAEYVLTDSFHGTVFSILFKKKFITFYRFSSNNIFSKNSRIDSLLGQLGLLERIYREEETISKIYADINYDIVFEKLKKMRTDSKKFLEDSLKECQLIYESQYS